MKKMLTWQIYSMVSILYFISLPLPPNFEKSGDKGDEFLSIVNLELIHVKVTRNGLL